MILWTDVVIFGTDDIKMKKKISSSKSGTKRKTRIISTDPAKEASLASEAQVAYAFKGKEPVVDFLGISHATQSRTNDETYFIDLIRKGIPRHSIDVIIAKTGMTEEEIASILHISRRTLQRKGPAEALNPELSERLVELARLYTKGTDVFGDLEDVKEWMDERILTLGNKKPKDFLDTSIGISLLLDELGRIEHGVYS